MQQCISQLGAVVLLLSNLLNVNTPAAAQTLEAQETAPAVIEVDHMDEWLDRLVQMESNGRADIKHLDVNGKYSYGCLQFQMATFVSHYPLLGEPAPEEYEKAIYDCDLQKRLAKAILKDKPAKWTFWFTSIRKKGLGLPPSL